MVISSRLVKCPVYGAQKLFAQYQNRFAPSSSVEKEVYSETSLQKTEGGTKSFFCGNLGGNRNKPSFEGS